MLNALRDRLTGLRNPQYTGANRCRPCTVLNVVIAGALAAALLAVSAALAVAVLAVSLALIALRGYLVPGTPALTARYLPARVRAWFDKPTDGAGVVADPDGAFRRAGAVDGAGRLTEAFRTDWTSAISRVGDADGLDVELAAFLDVDPAAVTVRSYDDGIGASVRGVGAGRWASRGAMAADIAAARTLEGRGVTVERDVRRLREQVGGLRSGLTACPLCAADLAVGEATAVACCGASTTTVLTCPACSVRWYEAERERPAGIG